jgi:hypothetical protein
MASVKKTSFSNSWLLHPDFKLWVAEVKSDPFSAHCKLCKKSFTLSNMGVQALTSHMKGKKHQSAFSASQNPSLLAFYSSTKPTVSSAPSKNVKSIFSENVKSDSSVLTKVEEVSVSNSSLPSTCSSSAAISNKPRGLSAMLQKDNVSKAEIIWCLQSIFNHTSQRSAAEAVNLFSLMFPDSEIASKIKLQRTKIGYTIIYGLAPYFFRALQKICATCNYIVIGFDESLNKITEKGQMDTFVRFWNPEMNQVCTRYYNSSFLGHAT